MDNSIPQKTKKIREKENSKNNSKSLTGFSMQEILSCSPKGDTLRHKNISLDSPPVLSTNNFLNSPTANYSLNFKPKNLSDLNKFGSCELKF